MLKHCTEKGDSKKIALIVQEMRKHKGIQMTPAKFGQDSRDWFIDKDHSCISQSLSSVKYISHQNADALYEIKDIQFDTFVDLLRYLQMNTSINTRQILALINIGYFERFGKRKKLLTLFNEFFFGKNKLTKIVKSYEKRLESLRMQENQIEDEDIDINDVVRWENQLLGMCFSRSTSAPANAYLVQEVDDTYSLRIKLYSLSRGTSGVIRMRKQNYERSKFKPQDILFIDAGRNRQKYSFKDGKRMPIAGEFEYWVESYHIESTQEDGNENLQ